MFKIVLIFSILSTAVNCQLNLDSWEDDFRGFETLGDKISQQVQASLAPLSGKKFLHHSFNLGGLEQQIKQQVQQSLAPLDNLGDRITSEVYASLEPVRAMAIVQDMKNGIGGTTIVKYLPHGKTLIIRDADVLECVNGQINENTGRCSGNLQHVTLSSDSDYCYAKSSTLVNNRLCLSLDGALSVSVSNNHFKCTSTNHTPVLLTNVEDYKKLCNNLSRSVLYTYIANKSDVNHVKIPSQNKHVRCDVVKEGICSFKEKNGLLQTSTFSTGNIFIGSSNI